MIGISMEITLRTLQNWGWGPFSKPVGQVRKMDMDTGVDSVRFFGSFGEEHMTEKSTSMGMFTQ